MNFFFLQLRALFDRILCMHEQLAFQVSQNGAREKKNRWIIIITISIIVGHCFEFVSLMISGLNRIKQNVSLKIQHFQAHRCISSHNTTDMHLMG